MRGRLGGELGGGRLCPAHQMSDRSQHFQLQTATLSEILLLVFQGSQEGKTSKTVTERPFLHKGFITTLTNPAPSSANLRSKTFTSTSPVVRPTRHVNLCGRANVSERLASALQLTPVMVSQFHRAHIGAPQLSGHALKRSHIHDEDQKGLSRIKRSPQSQIHHLPLFHRRIHPAMTRMVEPDPATQRHSV